MLSKIRRKMFWGSAIRLVYWVVIIGASLGAYYYLQPYLDSAMQTLDQAKETFNQIQSGVDVVSDGVTTTTEVTTGVIESIFDLGNNLLGF